MFVHGSKWESLYEYVPQKYLPKELLEIADLSTLLAHRGDYRDTITLRYAELLNADSTLYTDNLRSAECTDRYIAVGAPEKWWIYFPVLQPHSDPRRAV